MDRSTSETSSQDGRQRSTSCDQTGDQEQLPKVNRSPYDHAGHDYAQHHDMRLGMQQVMCVMYVFNAL